MARKDDSTLAIPFQDKISSPTGLLSYTWEVFFRHLYQAISPLGLEKSFQIVNNQTLAVAIDGLQFDFTKVNHVIIDMFIQRVGMGIGAVELLESMTLHLVYKPRSATWALTKIPGHGNGTSGVTLSTNAKGQVLYASDNQVGDFSKGISKMTFRARTLSAKYPNPVGGWL